LNTNETKINYSDDLKGGADSSEDNFFRTVAFKLVSNHFKIQTSRTFNTNRRFNTIVETNPILSTRTQDMLVLVILLGNSILKKADKKKKNRALTADS
jgi:hypothetical protein